MENRILLVDDEPDIREVLSITIADIGYSVYTAENGEKALKQLNEVNPSIVLTDIKMPGMDGLELLDRIKAQNPNVEVIMITGHGDMELAIQSLQKDACDFITKPINDHALENALKKAQEKLLVRQKLKKYTKNLENVVIEKSNALTLMESKDLSRDALREISDSQNVYEKIFDEIPYFVAIIDKSFKVTASNNLFKKNFSIETPEHYCYHVCAGKDTPCSKCPAIKTFNDGQAHQSHMDYISRKGKKYLVMVSATPLKNKVGKTEHVIVMSASADQITGLQGNLSSLGLMIGSVSHGLKGLLTGLDGGMYLLNTALEKDDTNDAKEGLAVVKSMAERIRSMVFDLLYYSKERKLTIETVDVMEFAKEVASIVELKINWQNIKFIKDFHQATGNFDIDAAALRSALVNVLENAIDACLIEKVADPQILFCVKTENDCIIIEVQDNGAGMDSHTAENIFQLFFSTKGKHGTGLGLYIVNKVIKQHHGKVAVVSKKGEGTNFTIQMPKTISESG